jgi:carbon storage regulator CsrA
MLVLTRQPTQSLIITVPATAGPVEIELEIIDIRADGKVRIGTSAPRSVTIDRKEIHLEKQMEKRAIAARAVAP